MLQHFGSEPEVYLEVETRRRFPKNSNICERSLRFSPRAGEIGINQLSISIYFLRAFLLRQIFSTLFFLLF